MLLTVTVFWLVAGVAFVQQASEHTVSVPFRPSFHGASEGRYPSGLIFSPGDIVAAPVMAAVFEANDLKRYVPFEQFSNSVVALRTSGEGDMIAAEYQAKLADSRLSTVDRSRLEEEFRSRMRSVPLEYRLTAIAGTGRWDMPDLLMQKVLSDVLATWARQAVELRGAISYQQEVVTEATFNPTELGALDPLRRLDVLRAKIHRLILGIRQLEELPGGKVVRGGADNLSLPEMRARLEDLLRFHVEPAYSAILTAGLVTNPREAIRYFQDQLRHVQRRAAEANGRREALQRSLAAYLETDDRASTASALQSGPQGDTPAGAPLSESVIDRLMALGSREADLEFRQNLTMRLEQEALAAVDIERQVNFYEAIVPLVAGGGSGGDPQQASAAVDQILEVAKASATDAAELYRRLSENNLNPQGQLYQITGPFSSRVARALTPADVTMYFLITLVSVLLAASAGILIYSFATRQPKPVVTTAS